MQQYSTLCKQHEWTKSPTLWRHTSPPRLILHLNYFSHATDSNYTVLSLLNTSRPLKALLILHLNWFYHIIEGNHKTIVSANCVYVSKIIGFTFPDTLMPLLLYHKYSWGQISAKHVKNWYSFGLTYVLSALYNLNIRCEKLWYLNVLRMFNFSC